VSLNFNLIRTSEGGGRRAEMHLPHRTVQTPVFMSVATVGTVKAVPQDVLDTLGAQIILGNTYHLYLRPGHELVRRMGGLHKFIRWPRAMLTDSGGYQVFSVSHLRKVTDEGVRFRSHLDGGGAADGTAGAGGWPLLALQHRAGWVCRATPLCECRGSSRNRAGPAGTAVRAAGD
jgi:hypothetical protein